MEFISTVRLREARLRALKLTDPFVMSDVALYDKLEYFDGTSITLDGEKNGCLHSFYPVTRKCSAELYLTKDYAHYVFQDEGGWIRAFSMLKREHAWVNTFRLVSTQMGILKGEYTPTESELTPPKA